MNILKVREWLRKKGPCDGIYYAIERPGEIYLSRKSRASNLIWTKNSIEAKFFKEQMVAQMVIEKNIDVVEFQEAFVSQHYFL